MKQSRRVSPRIAYDEAVCLTRVDGRGRLFGRSLDLGPSGVYLTCAELCEIGTEVVCAVPLPGGPRRLSGRVVRLVALPDVVGIAVAFTDVKEADRLVIERLVASRAGAAEPVKLRLPGLDHDLRCEAVVDELTMRVSTTLPSFLRLENGVDVVRLAGGGPVRAGSPGAHGVISRISIDPSSDGVPRLSVDVEMSPRGEAGGEADARARREPPSALPRPYRSALPKVLLSERFAIELVADAPTAPAPPRRRARDTAAMALRFADRLTSPPTPAEEDVTRKTTAALALPDARPAAALWLFLPLVVAALGLLLRHLGR
jgi:hypothetical protein